MFKKGDKVKCIKSGGQYSICEELYTVTYVDELERLYLDEVPSKVFDASYFELWEPKKGEMILVSANGKWFAEHEFLCMDGDEYVCRSINGMTPDRFKAWEYAKPVPKTHTIIIDGKEIELSEKSYWNMVNSLFKEV